MEIVAGLLEGDFYFHIAARRAGIHSGGYSIEVQPHERPLLVAEYDQRDSPACKVLLVSNVFAGV
jgi:hypothetical protein